MPQYVSRNLQNLCQDHLKLFLGFVVKMYVVFSLAL